MTACGGRRSEQYRGQGDIYLRQGEIDRAVESYQLAISADGANANAHLGLARALARQNKPDEALAAYRRVIELKPDEAAAYGEAAKLLQVRGDTEAALALAEDLKQSDHERGVILQTAVLRDAGRSADAVAAAREAAEARPDSETLWVNLGMALLAANQPADAETALRRVLDQVEPASTPARVLLVDAYKAQGKVAAMITELERLAQDRPDDRGAQLALALSYLETGRVDDAERIANTIAQNDPESGWANYVAGLCRLQRGNAPEAVELLEKAEQALPGHPAIASALARAKAGGAPAAGTVASVPPGAPPSPMPAAAAAADWQTLWRDGRLSLLLSKRGSLDLSAPNLRETLVLTAMFLGQTDTASELATPLPENGPVRRYLASLTALQQGEPTREKIDALITQLNEWKEEDPERKLLRDNAEAFALSRMGLRAEAFTKYSGILEGRPDHGVSLRNLADMYTRAGMPEYAAACYQKLVAVHRDNTEAARLLIDALLRANRRADAQTFAESAFSLRPNDVETIANLARVYLINGEVAAAVSILEQSTEQLPQSAELKVRLAAALVRNGNSQRALEVLEGVTSDERELLETIFDTRAFAHADLGQWEQTAALLEAQTGPLRLPLAFLLCSARVRADRAADAAGALPSPDEFPGVDAMLVRIVARALGRDAALEDPAAATLAQNLAGSQGALAAFTYALALRGGQLYEKAYDRIAATQRQLTSNRILVQMIFDALALARNLDTRVAEAERWAQEYGGLPAAWLGLAEVYRSANDPEGERRAIDRAVGLAPNDPAGLQRLALFAERQNDDALALSTYERLYQLMPEDPAAQNNLAYYLLKTGGDTARALELARKAAESLQANPNVLHTLGLAQLRSGDLDGAERNLKVAVQWRPGDPTLLLDYGHMLIQKGQEAVGRNYVRLGLIFADEFKIDFPRRAEAERLVQQADAA